MSRCSFKDTDSVRQALNDGDFLLTRIIVLCFRLEL